MRLTRSICTACGFAGAPTTSAQGSLGVEIVLWFFFMIPGLIYSLWRLSNKNLSCPSCRVSAMIPVASPNGISLLKSKGGWTGVAEQHFLESSRSQIFGRLPLLIIVSVVTFGAFAINVQTLGILSSLMLAMLLGSMMIDWPRRLTIILTVLWLSAPSCGDVTSAMMGVDGGAGAGAAGTMASAGSTGTGGGSGGEDAGLPPIAWCLNMPCDPAIHDACWGYVSLDLTRASDLYCLDGKYATDLPTGTRCTPDRSQCWTAPWPKGVPCSFNSDCKSASCLKGTSPCPATAQYGDCLCS